MIFPAALHILTYDMHGTVVETGEPKPARQTGLVVHTHQLLNALAARHPDTRWSITQTGRADTDAYWLQTPDGPIVLAQGIDTAFDDHMGAQGSGKDPQRVRHFYEDTIDDAANPVYRRLAHRYAGVIARAGAPDLIAQNINPIVSVLKAEEFGDLDRVGMGQVRVTGVVHDLADAPARFDYLRRRLDVTGLSVRLVAVSSAVAERLDKAGIAPERVHTVPNGLDCGAFLSRLAVASGCAAYPQVAARNGLPQAGTMVLLSARRVAWKGHLDLIEAMRILRERGRADGVFVVINGHGLHDTRDRGYTDRLRAAITRNGLGESVFLLDELNQTEVAACYGAADIAVLPSREPEAFGYANIEAMLAGAAVITTDQGGPRDYITHGQSGLLVPPCDPAALADALASLVGDPGLRARIAKAGYISARRFSLQAMARGYAHAITSHEEGQP